MAFFNEFPHTRTYDNDLGWIIKTVKALEENLQNFIKLNTVKYADPIQWDISNQYESNTVVIDALTGVAYISTQPVPTGVNINNKDYWTPVFTLDLVNLNKNITLRNDGDNHTATFESVVGDWILVGGQLYRVTQDIRVHTPYVVGFNIEIYTVELFVKDYLNKLLVMIGDLQDLDTEDKTSVVNAINEVLTTIGDLQDLDTEDKTSVVNAINSVVDALNKTKTIFNVLDYGVVADSDDNQLAAIQAVMDLSNENGGGVVYFPDGRYVVSGTIWIPENTIVQGNGPKTEIYYTGEDPKMGVALSNGGDNITIRDLKVDFVGDTEPPISGSQLGGIGISNYVYEYAKVGNYDVKRNMENILIENVYSDGRYLLQTEPENNYKILNVVYNKIFAPKSQISFSPSAGSSIYGSMNNVNASLIRVGYNTRVTNNINISNCITRLLRINDNDVNVNNVTIDATDSNNPYISAALYNCACFVSGENIHFNNVIIKGNPDITSLKYGIDIFQNTSAYFNNVICKDFSTSNAHDLYGSNNYFVNCDFSDANNYVCSIFGNGFNVKGNISADADFQNFTISRTYGVNYETGYGDGSSSFSQYASITKNGIRCHFNLFVSGSIPSSAVTKIASFNSDAIKPQSTVNMMGYAFNEDGSVYLPIIFRIDTNGNIYLVTNFITANFANCDRAFISDSYYIR